MILNSDKDSTKNDMTTAIHICFLKENRGVSHPAASLKIENAIVEITIFFKREIKSGPFSSYESLNL